MNKQRKDTGKQILIALINIGLLLIALNINQCRQTDVLERIGDEMEKMRVLTSEPL